MTWLVLSQKKWITTIVWIYLCKLDNVYKKKKYIYFTSKYFYLFNLAALHDIKFWVHHHWKDINFYLRNQIPINSRSNSIWLRFIKISIAIVFVTVQKFFKIYVLLNFTECIISERCDLVSVTNRKSIL